jgi:tetratricopeptide (TPR) repeat protein
MAAVVGRGGIRRARGYCQQLVAQSDEVGDLNYQALRLYQAAKYSEANPVAQQVLALAEKLYGPDHPAVAYSLNTLAIVYIAQGRYADAEPLLKRSLALEVKAHDAPSVAGALKTLAELYLDQGRTADAEPLLKRSLAIDEKALGPDEPDLANDLKSLAACWGSSP